MKFHADENVSIAVVMGLRRRGIDVTDTKKTELVSATDEKQLAFALRETRVMITHDADMLRIASRGVSHSGIAYCHVQKYAVGQLVRKLLALAKRTSGDAMLGQIEFL